MHVRHRLEPGAYFYRHESCLIPIERLSGKYVEVQLYDIVFSEMNTEEAYSE
jgi:hypothetical protein